MKKLLFSFLILTIAVACADRSAINESDAAEAVTDYLERNPEFETSRFQYGEMKFSSAKEREKLKVYQELAEKGLIALQPLKQKKKFLSRDSSYTYLVKLTDQARPLVLEQARDRATVRVFAYRLADDKPVSFKNVGSNRAEVTLSLKKEPTDFAAVADSKTLNSTFINKTYKLRYTKENGWSVKK
ncbi:hypothetical protein C7T94_00435 [Pedobacter yulinensis]|uniref:Uncharacterized protein n=1 Tax=Pedobacter yulinensis TaxID=2126353 RepID=A0A2T3HQD5_9SPHI|nr:hypothetical protein [Pedobacter yulinensis]PST84639.1 hypothetical protein C7T94_00435 [Pedobacter yulinensis]